MGILSQQQLNEVGFNTIGNNVRISDKASIYGADKINIGNNVRIDDFCVLSAGDGGIDIGNHVHIAIYSSLMGGARISVSNFANISSRVSIFSSSDDLTGGYMSGPVIPEKYKNVYCENVYIHEHVIIGCGTVVLPGSVLEEGCTVGALSLVKNRCESFYIYAGVPVQKLKQRDRSLLIMQNEFLKNDEINLM